MKNFEMYEKEIRMLDTCNLAIMKDSFEAVLCGCLKCEYCLFEDFATCYKRKMDWLYSECKEPGVLTDDERKLCELLGGGWIARDSNGDLYYYSTEPSKGESVWAYGLGTKEVFKFFPQCKFDFVKWEDEKPWEVRV